VTVDVIQMMMKDKGKEEYEDDSGDDHDDDDEHDDIDNCNDAEYEYFYECDNNVIYVLIFIFTILYCDTSQVTSLV